MSRSTPWQVYGDSAGLSRAVLNLMDNAAKWSPSGEHVGVRLRQLNASHAELVVSDHGPGIPEHERELVFERFFRSTTARADARLGAGAGDRQTGGAQTRRGASRRRHRSGRRAAGNIDLRPASGTADAGRGRTTRPTTTATRRMLTSQSIPGNSRRIRRTLSQSNLRPRRQGSSPVTVGV